MNDNKIKVTKRGIQLALGILWLLDGALQLQHQMFTSNFATQVLAPAANGQPRFVSGLIHLSIRIFLLHPAVFNSLIAAVQVLLGLLIVYKRTVRIGLFASMIWGMIVWSAGEGYGGILSGHTLLLMGLPGAAILYVLIALAVVPSKKDSNKDNHPEYWLALIWLVLWVGGAIYQLLPGQDSISSLSSMVIGNASGAPSWLAYIDVHSANAINGLGNQVSSMKGLHMTSMQMAQMPLQQGSGYLYILFFAAVQLCIGLGVLRRGIVRRTSIIIGIILALIFWVIGQSFGGYYTGLATDPSTAPLFILLALAIIGCHDLDLRLSNLGKKIVKTIV